MTAMINTVIFDMDGLMFDTETLYIDVFEDVCKKHGHAFPREYFLGMLGTSHFDYSISDFFIFLYILLLTFFFIKPFLSTYIISVFFFFYNYPCNYYTFYGKINSSSGKSI